MTTITASTRPVRASAMLVALAISAATLVALLVAWLVDRGPAEDTRAPAVAAVPAAAAYDPFADAFNTELRAVAQYDPFADAFNTELRAVPQYDPFADAFNTELRAVTAR